MALGSSPLADDKNTPPRPQVIRAPIICRVVYSKKEPRSRSSENYICARVTVWSTRLLFLTARKEGQINVAAAFSALEKIMCVIATALISFVLFFVVVD